MNSSLDQTTTMDQVPEASWKSLGDKRVYFGHQSVGYNIIEGIDELRNDYPVLPLNIQETSSPADYSGPVFGHSRIGENKDPLSKINAFAELMDGGLGEAADIVCFKFCYVDIIGKTDVESLFAQYKATMSRLSQRYPDARIVHITTPLTTVQSGPKAWIKRVVGRPIGGVADNIKRNRFNRMVREEYDGKEPVFDLATWEATGRGGKKTTFQWEEGTYQALSGKYTYDGGHLNEAGREWVAEQFLIFLSSLDE